MVGEKLNMPIQNSLLNYCLFRRIHTNWILSILKKDKNPKWIQDFDELMGELETADGITSDIFYKELVSGGTGNYSLSNQDIRHFYMGKLDLIHPSKMF